MRWHERRCPLESGRLVRSGLTRFTRAHSLQRQERRVVPGAGTNRHAGRCRPGRHGRCSNTACPTTRQSATGLNLSRLGGHDDRSTTIAGSSRETGGLLRRRLRRRGGRPGLDSRGDGGRHRRIPATRRRSRRRGLSGDRPVHERDRVRPRHLRRDRPRVARTRRREAGRPLAGRAARARRGAAAAAGREEAAASDPDRT